MTRPFLTILVLSTLVLLSTTDESCSEDARTAAFKLMNASFSNTNEYLLSMTQEHRILEDSVEYIFLMTSNSNRTYIPQEELGVTIVRKGCEWSIVTIRRREY